MNVVIKVNDEIKEKMIEYYKDKIGEKYGCSGTWIKKLVRKYEDRLKRRSGGSESK